MSSHVVPAENFVSTLRKDAPVKWKSMDEAHAEDYADKRRIDDLCRAIEAFMADPPSRAHEESVVALRTPLRLLKDDAAHIVRVWD